MKVCRLFLFVCEEVEISQIRVPPTRLLVPIGKPLMGSSSLGVLSKGAIMVVFVMFIFTEQELLNNLSLNF
jgi:hypothetical protein